MASKSLKRLRGRLIFFWPWWRRVFAGGFAKFGVHDVVFCVVDRGGSVVKTWLQMTVKRLLKNTPTFLDLFFGCMKRAAAKTKYRDPSLRSG
jgi:hypothetical protein